jgi:hypothetical protein
MTNHKTTSKERSTNADFKFCCSDNEKMIKMMQKFCGSEDGTSDFFRKMMQKMCCTTSEKSDKL